ncbi:dTDP-4-dehydrorhamnose reductase [Gilvimarinus sp. SDUM040013]|uniref:dTDP-4-dehydrorhamnose reductase n=1 Tax=Gilvimarinus gilvus TaxID=3058038 RepID=A0ABU4S1B6_9GAMM|nr:dTDP-4-dehydrorhamnose reductase [Gilvimarinus sp. SDUM040013]MDO3387335.1 dTDP-4-dehydrorhamnose reductase [Gilvimarinus sp. SDUM040013]MDX6849024.1 dTDP-4-dehydrorhamnose reductase [Gilvimarinus sp. SDUM040013]
MKILLLGQTGQVGFELKRTFAPLGTITAPTRDQLDLLNKEAVQRYLDKHQPALILNAAAYTAVDKAESEPMLATRLNTKLPAQLAEYTAQVGATLLHYSSDYVYPGQGDKPFTEQTTTGPLSAYGKTKLEGDQAITASGCNHYIFRTSWVYSARGHNFMKTMLRLGKDKKELKVVSDQIGAPTPARLIAQVSLLAYTHNIEQGVYHLAPRGETSWQGFARSIFRHTINMGQELTIAPEAVNSIPTKDYPTPARRPLNSRLSLQKLEQALSTQLPDWEDQLFQTLEEYFEYQEQS